MDDLRHLENALHTAAAYMASQAKYEDAAIFIGSTRSGKSSLINYIIGNKLVGEKFSSIKPVLLKKADNSPGPIIGLGSTSETIIPTRWDSNKFPELGIWDAPGFDDNRGAVQDITNAFYVNELFRNIKSAKIVLVTDINDIIHDNIRPFLCLLEAVEGILKDKMSECFSGIVIIFSKVPNILNDNPVDKNLICEVLKEQILSSKAIDISESVKNLIRYWIQKNQNIGFFKRPPPGPISDDSIDTGIVEAIKSSIGLREEILKQVSSSITPASKVFLYNVREKLSCIKAFDELQMLVGSIIEKKLIAFKKMKDEGLSQDKLIDLTQMLSITENKISKALDSSRNLSEKIAEIQSIDSKIEDLIRDKNLLQKAKWMAFVDQLLKLQESKLFDSNLNAIIVTAKSKIDELIIWIRLESGEISRKEAEAQALKSKQEFEERFENLKKEMKNAKEQNKKVEQEMGICAKVGHGIDTGVQKVGSAIYSGVETTVNGLKSVWNFFT